LVEKSIDQYQQPVIGRNLQFLEIQREVKQQDLFRFYLNNKYLTNFYACFSNEPSSLITTLTERFTFSGYHVDEENDELLIAQGYATGDAVLGSLITALDDSGTGSIDATSILPQQTALYFSLGFDDFSTVHENFYKLLEKQQPALVNEYTTNRNTLENFLKIDLEQDFYSWVDDEVAFAKVNTPNATEKDGLAVVFKTKDTDDAIEGLDKIREQIRKRTPAKFKTVSYRDHDINYLDIKGFFKLILGKLFKDIEKPYYVVLDDFVVFSNSPKTLKLFIDNYLDEQTLAQDAYYREFIDNFSSSSNVFLYINTNELSDAAQPSLTTDTRTELKKNEDFYTQFTQLGIELKAKNNLFYTKLIIHYDADYDAEALRAERLAANGSTSNQDAILDKETIFTIPDIFPDDFTASFYEKKYRNGKVQYKVYLRDAQPHGRFNEYYPDGTLKISGRYKKGEQAGLWKAYEPNGELFHKERF
jgi:antitoxin component YwqK of YwqJK toxin-antitoxin module